MICSTWSTPSTLYSEYIVLYLVLEWVPPTWSACFELGSRPTHLLQSYSTQYPTVVMWSYSVTHTRTQTRTQAHYEIKRGGNYYITQKFATFTKSPNDLQY